MSQHAVFKPKTSAILSTFGRAKAVIGVIHCLPLPGSPGYDGEAPEVIVAHAVEEAQRYERGGVHGLIVENHGDIPFSKPEDLGPETAALMAVIVHRVRCAVALPVGVNVLANGVIQALAVAWSAGGTFVRVNQWTNAYVANEGIIEGPAASATRYRARLRAQGVKVFADVHVKHGSHAIVADRSLAELTRDAEFFDADAVIATGHRTGDAADLQEASTIAGSTSLPLLIGSGVTPENAGDLLRVADGLIVASSLKEEGVWWTPVSERRVSEFMTAVRDHLGA